MILSPPATNIRQFTWNKGRSMMFAEASSTNGFGRVYDDACDEGLRVYNPRTGACITFAVDRTVVVDGELREWKLKPVKSEGVGFNTIKHIELLLFND